MDQASTRPLARILRGDIPSATAGSWVVPLAAIRTNQIPAPGCPLPVVVFRDAECPPATARHQKHSQRGVAFGLTAGLHPSSTGAIWPFLRLFACRTFFRSR